MAELKTKPTEITVESFLNEKVADENVRKDCYTIINIMEKITSQKAKMWGTAIIGFGSYHYKYDSGHEGEMCATGFSPRKANLTLYVLGGAPGQEELLQKIGKHKASGGCLHIKKLSDVNLEVLENLIRQNLEYLKRI